MRTTPAIRLACVLCALLAGCGREADLAASDARLVAPLPGQTTAVAYFTLRNSDTRVAHLIGARSLAAGAIEIHTHVPDGDLMRMRRLDSVDVEPGAAMVFAPGGHHLMVFRYTGPREGSVAIELQFREHPPAQVQFQVEERNGRGR